MVASSNYMTSLEAMGALLREVARLHVRAQRQQVECCDTTATQCHVLTELGRGGPMPMTELGQRLGLHKGWVSRAVGSLVGEGLLVRSPGGGDGRVVVVRLSRAGRRRLRALNGTLDRQAGRVLGHVPRAAREQVQRALLLVRRSLRRELEIPEEADVPGETIPGDPE